MKLDANPPFNLMALGTSSGGPWRHLLFAPSDPLFESDTQWHLGFVGSLGYSSTHAASDDAGLENIWTDFQGDGIRAAIWDDGIQKTHWDLLSNYDASRQVTVSGQLNDGQPITADDGHGTSVAGLIVAESNGLGGVGLAFDATITSVRIFGGADDINEAWSRYLTTLDSLSRFDVTNHSYGGYPDFRRYGDVAKFEAAAVGGRSGLGTINVKSAGNDNIDGNGDALDSSRFTITVAALSNTSKANAASYSTYGSHVLVSAPAAAVTTDLLGTGAGYDGLLDGDYTNVFGGTSAAGPVTAGVVVLMLDANPGLGWRDVQNILAYSSIGVGSLYSGVTTNENFVWKWNGATDWNGGGLHYSEDYGYGLVNVFNAVRMAEVWDILYPAAATSGNEVSATTGTLTVSRTIRDLSTLNYTFNVASNIALEHVSLTTSLTHTYFPDLRIHLISPMGTTVSLYDGSTGDGAIADSSFTYTFGADGFRGENSAGTWTLRIEDIEAADTGRLKSVSFTAYGARVTADDVYHYTSEVLAAQSAAGGSARGTIVDSNGGADWINAAAMVADVVINLRAGATSTMDATKFLEIGTNSLIENVIGGDGNDRLTGNDVDNILYGMRGDDVIIGSNGTHDVAGFRGNRSSYEISSLNGVTTVIGPDGTDTVTEVEVLRFEDQDIADPSFVDVAAPLLASSTPRDGAAAVLTTANVSLVFNEAVKAGVGNLSVFRSDGTLFESIDIALVNIVDRTVTADLAGTLQKDASYYVIVSSGAILDVAGNAYVGISSPTDLNFATERSGLDLLGDRRANVLTGSTGNDRIDGQAGADTLNGREGSDTLIGGAGRDVFVFNTALSAGNVDIILDYSAADDTIRLDRAIFSAVSATGTLASKNFRASAGGTAADGDDHILFDTASGQVYYDADGNGSSIAVHFATIEGLIGTVSRSDFVVI